MKNIFWSWDLVLNHAHFRLQNNSVKGMSYGLSFFSSDAMHTLII